MQSIITDLEVVDLLLGLTNVGMFELFNIGSGSVYGVDGHNKKVPILVLRFKVPVQRNTASSRRTDFSSDDFIPKDLQERVINLIHPFISPVEDEDIINSSAALVPENMRKFLAYRITQSEIGVIRRGFQITEILSDLEH